jgi:hypothetical protein
MTQQELNTALELKGKAVQAEQQAIQLRSLMEVLTDEKAEPRNFYFQFSTKSIFAAPVLKGLIEVFENQKERFEIEFQKL